MKNKQLDKIRGSLIGGAVGDALGYPVEFINSYMGIKERYGENGITRLDTIQWWLPDEDKCNKALISDDTQMTLFTACGLLNAKAQGKAPKYAITHKLDGNQAVIGIAGLVMCQHSTIVVLQAIPV